MLALHEEAPEPSGVIPQHSARNVPWGVEPNTTTTPPLGTHTIKLLSAEFFYTRYQPECQASSHRAFKGKQVSSPFLFSWNRNVGYRDTWSGGHDEPQEKIYKTSVLFVFHI